MLFSAFFCIFASILLQIHSSDDTPSKWKLAGNSRCPYGFGDVRKLEGSKLIQHPDRPVPEQFDARQNWPLCESISRIMDQGQCGACWAFAAGMMLSDRYCIENNGSRQFDVSVEDILTCCPAECVGGTAEDRCESGGRMYYALKYWKHKGVVSGGDVYSNRGCKPLHESSVEYGVAQSCSEECTNSEYNISYKNDRVFGKDIGMMGEPWNIKHMQIEIMINGPVITGFNASTYFQTEYTNASGVYQGTETELTKKGGHVLKIIGWGSENGVPFWLVANSWGTDWGIGGFGKILRGTNLFGLEDFAVTGYYHEVFFDFEDTTFTYSSASMFCFSSFLFLLLLFFFI